jgi:hypothetical protein
MTAYQKFRKLNNGIGFRNRKRLCFANNNKKNKKINADRLTLDFFDM